jgi:hypothetical protein
MWMIDALCTENRLDSSALLYDGTPKVSFERAIPG